METTYRTERNTLTLDFCNTENWKTEKREAKLLQTEDGAKHVVHLTEELDRMVVPMVVGARWRLRLLLLPPPQLEELLHYLRALRRQHTASDGYLRMERMDRPRGLTLVC